MQNESLLRAGLLILLAGMLPWAAYHRSLANRVGGVMPRHQEGAFIFIVLRLSGLVSWVLTFAWLIKPGSVALGVLAVPASLRWSGLALLTLGFAWLAWMFHALGTNVTDTVIARPNGQLVTTGPYQYVRHPMYASLFPIWLGLSLVTANWLVAAAGTVAMIALKARTRIEERNLIARYGAAYEAYMRTTGGLFPRF